MKDPSRWYIIEGLFEKDDFFPIHLLSIDKLMEVIQTLILKSEILKMNLLPKNSMSAT